MPIPTLRAALGLGSLSLLFPLIPSAIRGFDPQVLGVLWFDLPTPVESVHWQIPHEGTLITTVEFCETFAFFTRRQLVHALDVCRKRQDGEFPQVGVKSMYDPDQKSASTFDAQVFVHVHDTLLEGKLFTLLYIVIWLHTIVLFGPAVQTIDVDDAAIMERWQDKL
ncbi:hypothetical protein BJ138DRAFT_1168651 [Hygrophoropsis aurantiaca]|uniref:Uncharacterized protein n=1 Tax=Hygrophoropsis aurantiaca TaxID=72124 RepID=A0ACB7ZQR5_9AGAM|nr:hypothetical protein BJ138DRAFT_1168651 [Hygrophoropsis aurantiaca]